MAEEKNTAKPKTAVKKSAAKTPVVEGEPQPPTEQELMITELRNQGFILVQWIGSSVTKIAPSPTGVIRKLYLVENYGLVKPNSFLMVHEDDQAAAPNLYRKPDVSEKPSKDEVKIAQSGPAHIRVTWDQVA